MTKACGAGLQRGRRPGNNSPMDIATLTATTAQVLEFLSAISLLSFIVVAAICVAIAFVRGNDHKATHYVDRFRRRARYLRWLSMACLAALGAMLVAAMKVATPENSPLGVIAVFGLVVAVLASVYRYIVRLAYFYDSRADAFEIVGLNANPSLGLKGATAHLAACARLIRMLSPEPVEFSSTGGSLDKILKLVSKK